jgi:hypothetical protein
LRIFILGSPVQALKVLFHPAVPIPTHNRGWNLIANRIAEDSRVASAGPDTSTDAFLDAADTLLVIEKSHMLFPGQTHHDPQTVALGRIKQPARWYGIGADGVQAVVRHLGKVTLDPLGIVILVAILIRTKCPVCDTLDPQLCIPNEEIFPLDFWPV